MAVWLNVTFFFWFFIWLITVHRYGGPFRNATSALILWAVTGGVPVLIFKLVG